MPYTEDAFNKILDLLDRAVAITFPSSWYFGFHLMNTVTTGVTAGGNQVEVQYNVTAGAKVVLSPETADAEEFSVLSISGSGPYVLTLSGNLAHSHALNAEILCDPGKNGQNTREPSGAGYARVARVRGTTDFASASGGSNTDATDMSFATITGPLGTATHWVKFSASTSGTVWEWGRLTRKLVLDTSANPIKFPAGNRITKLTAQVC